MKYLLILLVFVGERRSRRLPFPVLTPVNSARMWGRWRPH